MSGVCPGELLSRVNCPGCVSASHPVTAGIDSSCPDDSGQE